MYFNLLILIHNKKNFSILIFSLFCLTIMVFSSQSNFKFFNNANALSCSNLPISKVTDNGNDGHLPSNVLDNNLSTRWADVNTGAWILADLGSTKKNICNVNIAWYKGNERQYNFVISTSTDGVTFTTKLSSKSSGTTLNSEK
jgi:F5/8 type C domain